MTKFKLGEGRIICKIRKWKLSDATDYISSMLLADENETFAFAITIDNKVIGSIGVYRQGNIHRQTAELGYYIAEEYWGKGIMTEAVKQICEYVFRNSDMIRIYAEPFACKSWHLI